MSKQCNTPLFVIVSAAIVFGILVILKPRHHHHSGAGESAGKYLDSTLKELSAALSKANHYVQHTIASHR